MREGGRLIKKKTPSISHLPVPSYTAHVSLVPTMNAVACWLGPRNQPLSSLSSSTIIIPRVVIILHDGAPTTFRHHRIKPFPLLLPNSANARFYLTPYPPPSTIIMRLPSTFSLSLISSLLRWSRRRVNPSNHNRFSSRDLTLFKILKFWSSPVLSEPIHVWSRFSVGTRSDSGSVTGA